MSKAIIKLIKEMLLSCKNISLSRISGQIEQERRCMEFSDTLAKLKRCDCCDTIRLYFESVNKMKMTKLEV
jgi:hypothetical protein